MSIPMRTNAPILLSGAVALALSGCAAKHDCCDVAKKVKVKPVVKAPEPSKDAQIAALKAAIAEAKNKKITKVVQTASSLYPPNAKSGQCYARVLTPAKFKLVTEKVLSRDSVEHLQIIPAKYKWAKKRVLVAEATEKIVSIPASYKTIQAKVVIAQATNKIITTPPVYKTVKEKVLVAPAHTVWRKGRGPIEKVNHGTGEILCLINVPDKYRVVTRKVLVKPASTKQVESPAKYKIINKKVIDKPASSKRVVVPAKYKVIKVKELVSEAKVKRSTQPEEYRSVQKRVQVSDAEIKWQPVACQASMTKVNISSVQKSLKQAGINPGPIDGIMGKRTKSALHKFQKKNGLTHGALTKETLSALGL